MALLILLPAAQRAVAEEWLVIGGVGGHGDCLSEWKLRWGHDVAHLYESGDRRYKLDPSQLCVDGDATCDADDQPGQCTFRVGMCFCVDDDAVICDRRAALCTASAPGLRYALLKPKARSRISCSSRRLYEQENLTRLRSLFACAGVEEFTPPKGTGFDLGRLPNTCASPTCPEGCVGCQESCCTAESCPPGCDQQCDPACPATAPTACAAVSTTTSTTLTEGETTTTTTLCVLRDGETTTTSTTVASTSTTLAPASCPRPCNRPDPGQCQPTCPTCTPMTDIVVPIGSAVKRTFRLAGGLENVDWDPSQPGVDQVDEGGDRLQLTCERKRDHGRSCVRDEQCCGYCRCNPPAGSCECPQADGTCIIGMCIGACPG